MVLREFIEGYPSIKNLLELIPFKKPKEESPFKRLK
jgi:hypothetical protein